MSHKLRFWILAGLGAILVGGSWIFFLHIWNDIYWCNDRYCLVALDSPTKMNLSFYDEGYYSELVGPTVYAIGANEKFLVLKQHPAGKTPGSLNRAVTNFYIIVRTPSTDFEDRLKGVRGPLTQDDFKKISAKLSLPKFSKTFRDLE